MTSIRVGYEVEVKPNVAGGDFIGEKGIVTGFDSNMFGSLLVNVLLHARPHRAMCFYPYELQIVRTISSDMLQASNP